MVSGLQRTGVRLRSGQPSNQAVLEGDHFVINGQKIWTSGAQYADWMFALVRTNPDAAKTRRYKFRVARNGPARRYRQTYQTDFREFTIL